jgi:hypothetical protein
MKAFNNAYNKGKAIEIQHFSTEVRKKSAQQHDFQPFFNCMRRFFGNKKRLR